jgi:hypothetical protein
MYTHAQLGEACERLGLPQSPEGTKHERVSHSFAALPHADLPMVAERIFGVGGDRNRIERSVPGLSENRGVCYASACSDAVMDGRVLSRAGTDVSPVTTIIVLSTAAPSHQAGGWLTLPPWLAARNRP